MVTPEALNLLQAPRRNKITALHSMRSLFLLGARARQQKALPEIEFRLASCDRNRFEVIAEFHDLWLIADGLPAGKTLSIRIAMHHEVCPIGGHDLSNFMILRRERAIGHVESGQDVGQFGAVEGAVSWGIGTGQRMIPQILID